MDVTIVSAGIEHLDACAAALQRSDIGAVYFAVPGAARAFLRDGIDKGEVVAALAETGACAGCAWIAPSGAFCRFPYLRTIAVDPAFRGRGVGAAILRHFEENGFRRARSVFLLVSDFNVRAQSFYLRHGYSHAGTLPDLIRTGIAELLMVKSLPSEGD